MADAATNALLNAHLDRRRFEEAFAVACGAGCSTPRSEALALLGQRLVRLDLEDVRLHDRPDLWRELPQGLRSAAGAVSFPGRHTRTRGALSSFVPLYRAMFEAARVRWDNGQTLHFLSIVHLLAEFAGHLAWESTLGHAADPPRLIELIDRRDSRWGDPDDRECGHHRTQRRLAEKVRDGRALRSDEQWTRFLREEYSRLGEMLTVCATRDGRRVAGSSVRECRADCAVWNSVPVPMREHQRRRARLALLLSRSSIVQLRHSAPIGHFFGVPDVGEIELEWADVARRARREADLDVGDGDLVDQLRVYCSAIAGAPLKPATTIGRIADQLRAEWVTSG